MVKKVTMLRTVFLVLCVFLAIAQGTTHLPDENLLAVYRARTANVQSRLTPTHAVQHGFERLNTNHINPALSQIATQVNSVAPTAPAAPVATSYSSSESNLNRPITLSSEERIVNGHKVRIVRRFRPAQVAQETSNELLTSSPVSRSSVVSETDTPLTVSPASSSSSQPASAAPMASSSPAPTTSNTPAPAMEPKSTESDQIIVIKTGSGNGKSMSAPAEATPVSAEAPTTHDAKSTVGATPTVEQADITATPEMSITHTKDTTNNDSEQTDTRTWSVAKADHDKSNLTVKATLSPALNSTKMAASSFSSSSSSKLSNKHKVVSAHKNATSLSQHRGAVKRQHQKRKAAPTPINDPTFSDDNSEDSSWFSSLLHTKSLQKSFSKLLTSDKIEQEAEKLGLFERIVVSKLAFFGGGLLGIFLGALISFSLCQWWSRSTGNQFDVMDMPKDSL